MKRYQIIEHATGDPIPDVVIESTGEVHIVNESYYLAEMEESGMTLDEIKALYIRQIDAFAGDVRARFMSRGFGQEITYVEKRLDALNYIAAGSPEDASAFPFIHNEASSTGQTPAATATMIIGRSDALRQLGSVIEAQRIRGGKQVQTAVDLAETRFVRDFAIISLDSHKA